MNIKKYLLFILIGAYTHFTYTCRVTIVNDLKETVIVGDKMVKELKIINANESDFVGAAERKPVITVYVKEYAKGPFKKRYEIKMIGCAMNPEDAIVRINQIIQDTYNKEIFSATPYVNQHKMLIPGPEHNMPENI